MKLNEGQQQAVSIMSDGFLSGKEKGLTLLGEGGTGKTTCVMFGVEAWLKAGLRVLITAPTNKAVKQLEKASREHGLRNTDQTLFCTVHKALGLAMLPSEENKYSAQLGKCIFDNFDVLVIDEGSMISQIALFNYILPELTKTEVKLVIMGDKEQLPPPRESVSLALEMDQYPQLLLTKVERFKSDSNVAMAVTAVRRALEQNKPFEFNAAKLGIEAVKPAYFIKKVVENFDKDTNLDDQRALAWTNLRVDLINEAVRKKIYGRDVKRFELGERVVTGAPVYDHKEVLLSTDEECIVTNLQESSLMNEETGKEYNTYLVTLEPIHAEVRTVYAHVIHESSQMMLDEDLQEIASKARDTGSRSLWVKYHTLKDLFSDVKFCYCITLHRSQGSTFKRVFLDTHNVRRNKKRRERNQLLNVGMGRTSEHLVVSNEQFIS